MPDKPDNPPPVFAEQIPSVPGGISAIASAYAPFIYFDGVPNFGFRNGIANLTLEVIRLTSTTIGTGGVVADRVSVAHLRMNMEAVLSLKSAIEGIQLLAKPVPEGEKN